MCVCVCVCACVCVCVRACVCVCVHVHVHVYMWVTHVLLINLSGEHPTMPQLLHLNIPQQVGTNYSTFGIFLLNDETGSRVDTIENTSHENPERITRKILQEWLQGKGLPPTWESLIQTLRDTGLSTLADKVETDRHLLCRPPPPKLLDEQPPQKKRRIAED